MNNIKPRVWHGYLGKRSDGMTLYFRSLTLNATTCPPTDVCVHSRPNIPRCDEFLRGTNPWVRKSMERVEYGASPVRGNKWTIRSS